MDALISGQAGTAVCIDGKRIYSVDWDTPDSPVERHEWEIPLIFQDAPDVFRVRNIGPTEIIPRLKTAWEKDRSLQLILILLDCEEDEDTRLMAAECLNDFMADIEVTNHVAS